MMSDLAPLVIGALAALAATPWLLRRPAKPRSRVRRRESGAIDQAIVLDLVRAALVGGADVITALTAVAQALPDRQAQPLSHAARALQLGASWDTAWPAGGAVADALAPAWQDGVAPERLLQHAAEGIRQQRQADAREAAARLGVRLVLPLGLCLLPAFVLLGLVPVLIAAGMNLWG